MPAKLELINGRYTRDAAGLLTDAVLLDYETVVIIGLKDGAAHIHCSDNLSRLKLLGAIEQAKHHILNSA